GTAGWVTCIFRRSGTYRSSRASIGGTANHVNREILRAPIDLRACFGLWPSRAARVSPRCPYCVKWINETRWAHEQIPWPLGRATSEAMRGRRASRNVSMSLMRPTAGPNPFLDATAWQMLERVAARFPDREAIVAADRRVSYAEFLRESRRAARGLLACGVG